MGCGGVDARVDPNEFILPADVDADEVVKAVEAELRRRGDHRTDAPPVLKRRRGGPAAISCYHILRLGDGRFDRGRRFINMVISRQRRLKLHPAKRSPYRF